jgi:hypothetical protein
MQLQPRDEPVEATPPQPEPAPAEGSIDPEPHWQDVIDAGGD